MANMRGAGGVPASAAEWRGKHVHAQPIQALHQPRNSAAFSFHRDQQFGHEWVRHRHHLLQV